MPHPSRTCACAFRCTYMHTKIEHSCAQSISPLYARLRVVGAKRPDFVGAAIAVMENRTRFESVSSSDTIFWKLSKQIVRSSPFIFPNLTRSDSIMSSDGSKFISSNAACNSIGSNVPFALLS